MDTLAQCPGPFSVDDPHRGEAGDQSVVQILLKLCHAFVYRAAKEVDLGLDGGGFIYAVTVSCAGSFVIACKFAVGSSAGTIAADTSLFSTASVFSAAIS